MAERLEFREKLAGILTLCESQNNITDKATVEAYFAEDNLSAEQMELVFDYLLSKKVIVKGYVKAGGSIKNAENTEEPIRYTQEEQNYLNLYEQDLKGLRDGDPLKELLPAILTMAKEMHRADIYIGDLVQEGNMGLMLAMEDHADDTEALLSMAKESMQALLESQEETKKQDNRMVEKVNDLDEQIKKLSDELGRKVSVDELEEFAGITEDEISNILKLAGEELPPEEKQKYTAEKNYFTKDGIEAAIDWASKKHKTELLSFLMNEQHKRFPKKKKTFEL